MLFIAAREIILKHQSAQVPPVLKTLLPLSFHSGKGQSTHCDPQSPTHQLPSSLPLLAPATSAPSLIWQHTPSVPQPQDLGMHCSPAWIHRAYSLPSLKSPFKCQLFGEAFTEHPLSPGSLCLPPLLYFSSHHSLTLYHLL